MEEEFGNIGGYPQLFDLISNDKDYMKRDEEASGEKRFRLFEEEKLELRLGPPGGEDWPSLEKEKVDQQSSVLSLSYFSDASKTITCTGCTGYKMGSLSKVEPQYETLKQKQQSGPFQLQVKAGLGKVSSSEINGIAEQQEVFERNASPVNGSMAKNRTETRTASSPVVGWPPIRSFRKNFASSSLKPSMEAWNRLSKIGRKAESSRKSLLLKINMDGIPIGRKVDLNAYNSYEKLSSAVEELFGELLAAQKDPPSPRTEITEDKRMEFRGLLDGTGEFTLVYEDNEGDRMLVGDVPWDMFVSTAKRLRVLKSSELYSSSVGVMSSSSGA